MKKFCTTAALALLVVSITGGVSAPAHAATTSSVPTTSTNGPVVAKGRTIEVRVNARGSRVVSTSTSLFDGGRRVRDMSPAPGEYTAKTTIRYQIATTRRTTVWVADPGCEYYSSDGYDYDGDGSYDGYYDQAPYDACAPGEHGYFDETVSKTYGQTRSVVRTNEVRVHPDESPGCATFSEYRAVRNGMTDAQVKAVVGAVGTISYRYLTPGYAHITREFSLCSGDDTYDSMDVELYRYSPRAVFKVEDKGWYSY